jgi:hypothetical protein
MEGSSPLPFEEEIALPAVLKALEATEYHSDDFTDDERAWLCGQQFVIDNHDASNYSARLREQIGQLLFECLFPTEQMRGAYEQVRRQSAAQGVHVRLRFDVHAPLVAALPWELLHHGEGFLMAGGKGSLTRYLTFDTLPAVRSAAEELTVLLVAPRRLI